MFWHTVTFSVKNSPSHAFRPGIDPYNLLGKNQCNLCTALIHWMDSWWTRRGQMDRGYCTRCPQWHHPGFPYKLKALSPAQEGYLQAKNEKKCPYIPSLQLFQLPNFGGIMQLKRSFSICESAIWNSYRRKRGTLFGGRLDRSHLGHGTKVS